MRRTRRLGAVASIAAVALVMTAACTSQDGDGESTPTPTDTATDGGGDAPETPDGADYSAFEGQMVGAMTDYGIGTTFVATEPVEFGLFYRDHPNYPLLDDWRVLTALEEFNNVSFDVVSAPLSDWDQRKAVVIGAGDAPEIITVTYPGQEVQFVAGGAILPISDYVQYMPNYTDKVERWGLQEDIDIQLGQEDGRYYLLPGLRESLRPQYTYAVRSDIWDELGLSYEPATFEEFADQLRAVKAAYPDVYPLTDRWSANGPIEATLNAVAPNYGTQAGWGFGEGVTWTGSEFVYTGATDEHRQMVEFFAGLVAEGLMDPEAITHTDDQASEKIASGQALAIFTNDQEILKHRQTWEDAGNTEADLRLIRLPAGPAGDNLAAGGRLQSGLMLSSKAAESDHFLALLQFVDWLYYSDEGLEFAKWGVEGETFTRGADGARVLADDIDINGLNPGAPKALNVDFGFHNGVFMLEHGSTTDLDLSMLRPEVVEFVESMLTKDQLPLAPAIPLTELEREMASLWQSALKDIVWRNTAAFISGQRPMSDWDAHVAELEGANMQQYLDMVNEAAARAAG